MDLTNARRRLTAPLPRLNIGPLQVYAEPRDLWVGAFVAPQAVYVCPVPCLVLRWQRKAAG